MTETSVPASESAAPPRPPLSRHEIFDATLDQYGLHWKTHSLLTKEQVVASHMSEQGFESRSEERWSKLSETLSKRNDSYGYWANVVSQRMKELFEDLDWESLGGLSEEGLESKVRAIATDKLVGAWEEAQAQLKT